MRRIAERYGQTTLEYISVAVLTIIGIIFMGGYVNRAINAYFHDAETQVQDSYREKFDAQAPEDTSLRIPGCVCTTIDPPEVACGGGGCLVTEERVKFQDCSSPHCAGLASDHKCRKEMASDNAAWETCRAGKGGYPIQDETSASFKLEAGWENCGKYKCCTDPSWTGICGEPETKYDGYGLYDRYCGGSDLSENWQPFWRKDTANCGINCAGSINPGEKWCDENGHNTGLPKNGGDISLKYVTDCGNLEGLGSPYDKGKCVVQCLGENREALEDDGCECKSSLRTYDFSTQACECQAPNIFNNGKCWAQIKNQFSNDKVKTVISTDWYPGPVVPGTWECPINKDEESSVTVQAPRGATEMVALLEETYSDDEITVMINDTNVYAETIYTKGNCNRDFNENIDQHYICGINHDISWKFGVNISNEISVKASCPCHCGGANACAKIKLLYTNEYNDNGTEGFIWGNEYYSACSDAGMRRGYEDFRGTKFYPPPDQSMNQ